MLRLPAQLKKIIGAALFVLVVLGVIQLIIAAPAQIKHNVASVGKQPASPITIIPLPTSSLVSVEYDQAGKFISEWKHGGEEIIFNAAYFHEDYSPSGLLIIHGNKIGPRMFDQDKSGLLTITNNTITIRDLNTAPLEGKEKFDFAVQSFPFLIANSKPAVKSDSGKIARRTAIGVDRYNKLYVIVADTQAISLFDFMNEIIKTNISFTHVLNLDGGPSTGIYAKWGTTDFYRDSYSRVSSIIRFSK